jgi:histidine ammonia-lyase
VRCAAHIRQLIKGSTFLRLDDPLNVQDAYTLRCIPQVHGAVRDAIAYARWVLSIELNSATDNPLIFFDEESEATVLSGGNFHGEPVAIAMDYLALALTELGNISERRLTRLTDEASNRETLPAFLVKHGGLNSGFMLTQYTAAALASENKVLAHPASADTIPSSANVEDHVSMGPAAARQAKQIADNVELILALELFAAAQGIDFRRQVLGPEARLGRGTAPAYHLIRKQVPFLENDAVMYPHIEAVRELIATGGLVATIQAELQQ